MADLQFADQHFTADFCPCMQIIVTDSGWFRERAQSKQAGPISPSQHPMQRHRLRQAFEMEWQMDECALDHLGTVPINPFRSARPRICHGLPQPVPPALKSHQTDERSRRKQQRNRFERIQPGAYRS